MATTHPARVGSTRRRLAVLLDALFPEYHFAPEDINSNAPAYASKEWDCCSWDAVGHHREYPNVHRIIGSWNPMGVCVRKGIVKVGDDRFETVDEVTVRD